MRNLKPNRLQDWIFALSGGSLAAIALVFAPWGEKPAGAPPKLPSTPGGAADLRMLQSRAQVAIQKVLPAVVAVESAGASGASESLVETKQPLYGNYASGVIISADGLVLSQFHVSHRYPWHSGEPTRSRKPGGRARVALSNGRIVEAELLGADETHDLSLLRLLEPGPYPWALVRPKSDLRAGDWVLKFGHPIGYRRDRPAVARLGRVLSHAGELFVTDCHLTGGDSGGPFTDFDGRIVGIPGDSDIPVALRVPGIPLPERIFNCRGSTAIQGSLAGMLHGDVSLFDADVSLKSFHRLLHSKDNLPVDQWTEGVTTALAFRGIVGPSVSSVVEIQDASRRQTCLGTVVATDGGILTVASLLPSKPMCRLGGGQLVPVEVVGVNAEFDLALLHSPVSNLCSIKWSVRKSGLKAGAIVAAPGPRAAERGPALAVGIVSVPTRDISGPFTGRREHPRVTAELPGLSGASPTARGLQIIRLDANAGFHVDDVIVSIDGNPAQSVEDVGRVLTGRMPGEMVLMKARRGPKIVEFTVALVAKPFIWSKVYSDAPSLFEHDMPLLPAQCGGPVVDLDGEAVGVTIFRGQYGCMAIPADCVERLLRAQMFRRADADGGRSNFVASVDRH